MAAIPSIEPEGYRFDAYIQELQEHFATAGLSYGSPEDIVPLAARLQSSGTFAEDLTSLIRSIILREGRAVSRRRLLATVETAIAGQEIEHPPEHLEAAVDGLFVFVTEILRKPWDEPMAARATGPVLAVQAPVESAGGERIRSEESPAPIRQPLEFSGYSRSLAAALAAASPQPQTSDAERHERHEESGLRRANDFEGLRPSAEPQPEIAAVPLVARSHTVGLTARRAAWIAAGLISIALLLILVWRAHDSSGIVTTVGPQPFAAAGSASPAMSPISKPSAGRAATPTPGANVRYRHGTPAVIPTAPTGATSSPVDAASVQPRQAVGEQPPAPIERRTAGVEPSDSGLASRASSAAPSGAPRVLTNGRSSFEITSGVMSSHLIAARAPSYPFLARAANVQGEVVLQAVISRTGAVTAVRVLDGHRLLRGAAVAAVRHWRYRPYVADGRPVSVATIVTVDFRSLP